MECDLHGSLTTIPKRIQLPFSLGSAATRYHAKRTGQDGSTAEAVNSWVPRKQK